MNGLVIVQGIISINCKSFDSVRCFTVNSFMPCTKHCSWVHCKVFLEGYI